VGEPRDERKGCWLLKIKARLWLPVFLVSLSVFVLAFTALSVSQAHAASTTSVTVTSFPSTGPGYVTVDGYNITTPTTFTWTVGDNHTISANSPAAVVPRQSRYVYSSWSDGGEQSHTITVPSQATNHTADFQLQYYLTASGGYSTTGQGWYNNGTSTTASSNWLQSIQGNTTELAGLWHFDEGTGTTAIDSSGNGNNATIHGATWVNGKYGDALSFNGVNNYVVTPNITLGTSLTLSAWVNVTSFNPSQAATIVGQDNPNYLLNIYEEGNSFGAYVFGGTIATYSGVTTNTWYNVALTLNMTAYTASSTTVTYAFYVNGALVASGSYTNTYWSESTVGNYPIDVGAWPFYSYGYANAVIDDVHVYNRVLSLAEIQSLYYSRVAVTNWQLDGVNQNPTRQNTGTLTSPSITMNTHHAVAFLSTKQYCLTNNYLSGSLNSITASPTSDSWYDSGTSVTATLNNVWSVTSGQSRQNLLMYFNGTTTTMISRTGNGTTSFMTDMTTYRTVNDTAVTQYYLNVTGGDAIAYGTASPTSDNWYNSGMSTTVASNWVWNPVSGQSRRAIINWRLDSVDQNPVRRGTGMLVTSSVSMTTYHTVAFVSTMQYYLTVSGGNGVTYSSASPLGDNWYDSGSSTTVSSNWVWNNASSQSRTAITNWQLDGVNQNPARQNTGTLTTSNITMSTYHAVTFVSITQYLVSFQCMDHNGTETITPSSFQIELNNVGVVSVSDFKIWLDNGTKFQIYSIIWQNADVKPTNQSMYVANTPLTETILDRIFGAKFVVTDYLGIPVSDAQVLFTLANGTTIQLTTGSDGTLSLGLIPIGTFQATIRYLGTATEIHCDASTQSVIVGKILASYPTFNLIGGGIIAATVACVIANWYRRSLPFRAKVKSYVRVNWGAPFILGFVVLLVIAADSLSVGLADMANEVSTYAFCALVVGVVFQLVCFLKYNRKNDEKIDESS
jgi:hypothetical protein